MLRNKIWPADVSSVCAEVDEFPLDARDAAATRISVDPLLGHPDQIAGFDTHFGAVTGKHSDAIARRHHSPNKHHRITLDRSLAGQITSFLLNRSPQCAGVLDKDPLICDQIFQGNFIQLKQRDGFVWSPGRSDLRTIAAQSNCAL